MEAIPGTPLDSKSQHNGKIVSTIQLLKNSTSKNGRASHILPQYCVNCSLLSMQDVQGKLLGICT